jgi:cell wall-associated NlpC family hydrolase
MKNTIYLLLLLYACHAVKPAEMQNSSTAVTTNADSIAFFVFKISKNPESTKSQVKLINVLRNAGIMKEAAIHQNVPPNHLTLYLYHQKQLLDSIQVEHPLYKNVEYVTEDNKWAERAVQTDSAEFFVRWQTKAPVTMIQITETLENKGKTNLNPIKIP